MSSHPRPMQRPFASRFRHVLFALACVAAPGCTDPLSPGDVAGTYVLRWIDEQPLPLETSSGPNVRIVLLADTLRLSPDGTGSRVQVHESESLSTGDGLSVSRWERRVGFRIVLGRVEIGIICGPGELCTFEQLIARRSPLGLRVQYPSGGATLEYERVSPM